MLDAVNSIASRSQPAARRASPPPEPDRRPARSGQRSSGRSRTAALLTTFPGLGMAGLVAAAATLLSGVVGLGAAPVIAIVLGLIVSVVLKPGTVLRPGIGWSASYPLRAAVVVLGAELPLAAVASQGVRSLPGIVITLAGCLFAARLLGRLLKIPARLRALIGVGTSICGASAIAAVTPVIDAEQTEVGYAVTTIFLFNIAAVLTFPAVGHLLGLSHHSFGVFAGTAVNDLSSVVATASLYSASSLHTAVIVKLTRTLMIVPVSIILGHRFRAGAARAAAADTPPAAGTHRLDPAGLGRRALAIAGLVPGFLILFAALATLRGVGVIPPAWSGDISATATLLITLALAAVGLSVDPSALRRAGVRPLILGAALWVIVSLLSLGCQAAGLM